MSLLLRALTALAVLAAGFAVALLIAASPSPLPEDAWLAVAAFCGMTLAVGLPLLIEDRVHAVIRRWRPEAERRRALALLLCNAALLAAMVLGGRKALERAVAAQTGPRPSASALASTSASAPLVSTSAPASASAPPVSSLSGLLPPFETDAPPEDLFDRRADTVVVLRVRKTLGANAAAMRAMGARWTLGTGSGFVVDPAGLVVTNEHVIQGGESILARLRDGRTFERVTVLAVDVSRDLALLQLPAQALPAAPLAHADPRVGARALAIGNPRGLEHTLTDGIISALRERGDTRLLQFQTTIAPGSSGGPLFDVRGRVIGVTTETQGAGLNVAVRIEHVRQLLAAARTPRVLAPWGGEARIEGFRVEGAPLHPTDRGNIEDGLRATSSLIEPCLRDAGPATASLSTSTSRPGAGLGPDSFVFREPLEAKTDLTGPARDCIENPAKLLLGQLVHALDGTLPDGWKGKAAIKFRLVVPGTPPAAGRSLDVTVELTG